MVTIDEATFVITVSVRRLRNMAKKLTRADRQALAAKLKKRKSTINKHSSDEVQKLWKEADNTLGWIFGDADLLPSGARVDFGMFDFIVAKADFTPEDMQSDLGMLQRLWITLFPHLDKLIENRNTVAKSFRELEATSDTLVRNYAEQNFELQFRQEFMKEYQDLEADFQKYFEKRKAESEKKIEALKSKELAGMEARENKKKKGFFGRKKK